MAVQRLLHRLLESFAQNDAALRLLKPSFFIWYRPGSSFVLPIRTLPEPLPSATGLLLREVQTGRFLFGFRSVLSEAFLSDSDSAMILLRQKVRTGYHLTNPSPYLFKKVPLSHLAPIKERTDRMAIMPSRSVCFKILLL